MKKKTKLLSITISGSLIVIVLLFLIFATLGSEFMNWLRDNVWIGWTSFGILAVFIIAAFLGFKMGIRKYLIKQVKGWFK